MQGYLPLFSKYAKVIVMSVLIMFVGTLVVGITVAPQLNVEANSCLFDASDGCIGVSEHILQWQNTFNISPEQNIFVLLGTLLFALTVFPFNTVPCNVRYSLLAVTQRIVFMWRQRVRTVPVILFDYQRTLFAQGILHPKLF